jgi:hypothetical protein
MRLFSLIAIILLYANSISAQFQGKVYIPNKNAIAINNTGDTLLNPFFGGMNSIYVNNLDLNKDGKQDLVVYDYVNEKVWPFRNYGSLNAPKYKFAPQYIDSFPRITYYMMLRDYNCDNIPDLFEFGGTGVQVYKGRFVNNSISFVKYKRLYHPGFNGPVNVYVGPSDLPDIVDIDNDGDLDIITMHSVGTYMNYYKNLRVENNEPCDSLTFIENGGCFGGTVQGFFREWYLNQGCKMNDSSSGEYAHSIADSNYVTLDGNELYPTNTEKKKLRHGNNALLAIDLDVDNDKDFLCGNNNYNDMQALFMNNTNTFIGQDTLFNSAVPNESIYCPIYPSGMLVDYDGDTRKDLIIAPHVERNLNQFAFNNKCLFYKNTSGPNGTVYIKTNINPIFETMIDAGMNSYPTFYDADKDGKPDLIVGSTGTPDSNLKLTSRLHLYKNTSNVGAISLVHSDSNFLFLDSFKYNGIYPTFGDVDGDSISDLLIGTEKGKIAYFKNMAASDTVVGNFVWQSDSFLNINVGSYIAPCFFDANFDGKTDLIFGQKDGTLKYFEDTSTIAGIKSFEFKKDSLGKLVVGGTNSFGYAAPIAVRVDTFNRIQLLIGSGDGVLARFDSLQNNLNGTYTLLDSMYSFINYLERATPALTDLDGDKNLDLVVGSKLGGLQLYRQVLHNGDTIQKFDTLIIPDGIKDLANQNDNISLYPNPSNGTVYLNNKTTLQEPIEIIISTVTGAQVANYNKWSTDKIALELPPSASNGTYFYKITGKSFVSFGRFQLQRE